MKYYIKKLKYKEPKMGEDYCNLKRKLEQLGYNYNLSPDAVPLVECIVADLLQTTRSLQHYMDLSKEALIQRDSLILETEPYKCDNGKLIRENNKLHQDLIQLKEENSRLTKESKRKIKTLSEEILKKDKTINKLEHDIRDLSLRTLCTSTQSSRNRSKRKDEEDSTKKKCVCYDQKHIDSSKEDNVELSNALILLKEKNEALSDEILLLKSQVEHRDDEILRLNMLLEGGRPLTAVFKDFNKSEHVELDITVSDKIKQIQQENHYLKKEIESGLEKQHEAMLRALTLADENKMLKEELLKVDKLALQVEEDCNNRLATATNEISTLQIRLQNLTLKNSEMEKELSQYKRQEWSSTSKELLNVALKEKDILQKEIKDLIDINKNLQDKIVSLCQFNKCYHEIMSMDCENKKKCSYSLQKDELQKLLEDERLKYEKYIIGIQEKLTETLNVFNQQIPQSTIKSPKYDNSQDKEFIRDLHNRLCVSEQKILMLKKENEELKFKSIQQETCNKETFKDIIKHLNDENAQLTSENISLSQRVSKYNLFNSAQHRNRDEDSLELSKLKEKNNQLKRELDLINKDKQEYQHRYKESMDLVQKLKMDLALKQKEIEHLEEENCSYKMTNRTDKASAEHLKDECKFLREQIKKMQSDVIKEKTLSSQIKNIQMETERTTSEIQNELLSVQKKLSMSKDNISFLEKKCKELQDEISTLKADKTNLIENIKSIDQERDNLIIELDNKTECISNLEQKIKNQSFEINKLENEIGEYKLKLNLHKSSEHKIIDLESQIAYLNGEISRLMQKYDTSVMENKHLQNSLADVNCALKMSKLDLDKSKKEVDGLKQQLQHYVSEVRRIEELLSQKEAERSDMLEQFASLSVEANILENTNHSLESESASKSVQLQTYVSKMESLEAKLLDKENIIDTQAAHIAAMTCKITALENEIKLITDEKKISEQNVTYLKQMCNNLKLEQSHKVIELKDTDSELKLYENKIKSLTSTKSMLEKENKEILDKLNTTEKLLSTARREIVDLKLALQDATSETKSLQDCVSRLSRRESELHENALINEDINMPLTLEDTICEAINEEDEDILHSDLISHKPYKYSHGSTI